MFTLKVCVYKAFSYKTDKSRRIQCSWVEQSHLPSLEHTNTKVPGALNPLWMWLISHVGGAPLPRRWLPNLVPLPQTWKWGERKVEHKEERQESWWGSQQRRLQQACSELPEWLWVGVMVVTYLQPEKVNMNENWESKKPSFVSGSAICRSCDSDKVFNIYEPHFPHL